MSRARTGRACRPALPTFAPSHDGRGFRARRVGHAGSLLRLPEVASFPYSRGVDRAAPAAIVPNEALAESEDAGWAAEVDPGACSRPKA